MNKLKLKLRDTEPQVILRRKTIEALAGLSDEKLVSTIRPILENGATDKVHDLTWLRLIIDWVPEGGLPLTEQAKWMKLASRIAELDEDKEYNITLSPFLVNLIWSRMTDARFILNPIPIQFQSFIMDFQGVTGKHFEDEGDDILIEVDDG